MAREFAQMRLALWAGESMRALTPNEQHLLVVLHTSLSLSYCGVADWRPSRIAQRAAGWTAEEVRATAGPLIDQLVILVDESTEEVLLRTWIRDDGLMKQPKMATAMASAYMSVASGVLRGVIVHELKQLHRDSPGLKGWSSKSALALLANASVDPSEYPLGNPWAKGSLYPCGEGSGNPSVNGSVNPSVYPSGEGNSKGSGNGSGKGSVKAPPTTATATATTTATNYPDSLRSSGAATRKRAASPLPDDWNPTERHHAYATEHHLDLQREVSRFRSHAEANDRRQANWTAAFTNWLDKARDFAPPTRAGDDEEWRRWSEQ